MKWLAIFVITLIFFAHFGRQASIRFSVRDLALILKTLVSGLACLLSAYLWYTRGDMLAEPSAGLLAACIMPVMTLMIAGSSKREYIRAVTRPADIDSGLQYVPGGRG